METIDLDRWREMPLIEQMANIGSEVGRTLKWTEKRNPRMAESAFLRALDLIDATIRTGRYGMDSRGALLKAICRARDLFTESYLSSDCLTLSYLDEYFGQFAQALRR